MPYKSNKQRKFMHAAHPDIAKKWDAKYGGKLSKRRPKQPKKVHSKRRKQRFFDIDSEDRY